MKYRIKIVTNFSGEISYIPQKCFKTFFGLMRKWHTIDVSGWAPKSIDFNDGFKCDNLADAENIIVLCKKRLANKLIENAKNTITNVEYKYL